MQRMKTYERNQRISLAKIAFFEGVKNVFQREGIWVREGSSKHTNGTSEVVQGIGCFIKWKGKDTPVRIQGRDPSQKYTEISIEVYHGGRDNTVGTLDGRDMVSAADLVACYVPHHNLVYIAELDTLRAVARKLVKPGAKPVVGATIKYTRGKIIVYFDPAVFSVKSFAI